MLSRFPGNAGKYPPTKMRDFTPVTSDFLPSALDGNRKSTGIVSLFGIRKDGSRERSIIDKYGY